MSISGTSLCPPAWDTFPSLCFWRMSFYKLPYLPTGSYLCPWKSGWGYSLTAGLRWCGCLMCNSGGHHKPPVLPSTTLCAAAAGLHPKKQDGATILIFNKIDFKPKLIKREEDPTYSSKEKSKKMTFQFLTSIPKHKAIHICKRSATVGYRGGHL